MKAKKMKISAMSLAAAIAFASVGAAAAKDSYPAQADSFFAMYDGAFKPAHAGGDQDRYGDSGTRGRLGLGADSHFPEGPGNPAN